MKRTLRIAIDARIADATHGGIQQVIIGLAHGLSRLEGREEYLFVTLPGRDGWLAPYLHGPCRRLPLASHAPAQRAVGAPSAAGALLREGFDLVRSRTRRLALPIRNRLRPAWHALLPRLGPRAVRIPRSDGTVERAGVDVVHFPIQRAFRTPLPSIYHPHDLQHLHLPDFFSPVERLTREVHYRAFCAQAAKVAVTSGWVKRDLEAQYELAPDKVVVVPWAPVLEAYARPTADTLATIRSGMALPEPFILYPANFWPHKNHRALLHAADSLRRRHGLEVGLVFPGRQHGCFDAVKDEATRLGLQEQVRFPGFVTPEQLNALYALCHAVVIPSRFEAASFPLWEAFQAGVPAACSHITSLPEQANGAALLFDPDQPAEIADAIVRLRTEDALRTRLIEAGRATLARFTWRRTASTFRAHYRAMAGQQLGEEDRFLLTRDPGI